MAAIPLLALMLPAIAQAGASMYKSGQNRKYQGKIEEREKEDREQANRDRMRAAMERVLKTQAVQKPTLLQAPVKAPNTTAADTIGALAGIGSTYLGHQYGQGKDWLGRKPGALNPGAAYQPDYGYSPFAGGEYNA